MAIKTIDEKSQEISWAETISHQAGNQNVKNIMCIMREYHASMLETGTIILCVCILDKLSVL